MDLIESYNVYDERIQEYYTFRLLCFFTQQEFERHILSQLKRSRTESGINIIVHETNSFNCSFNGLLLANNSQRAF